MKIANSSVWPLIWALAQQSLTLLLLLSQERLRIKATNIPPQNVRREYYKVTVALLPLSILTSPLDQHTSVMRSSRSSNSDLSPSLSDDQNHLFRRKGGGGKGGGSRGGKSGSKGGSSPKSVAKKAGASDTCVNSRGSKSFAVSGTQSLSYAYSPGRGKHITLPASSSFSGREAGGGDRVRGFL